MTFRAGAGRLRGRLKIGTTAAAASSPLSFATLFVGDVTSMVNSGGVVQQWNSLDGGGVQLAQATAGIAPVYDGTNGLVFDGGGRYMSNSAIATASLATFAVFMNFRILSAAGTYAGLFSLGNGVNADFANPACFNISTDYDANQSVAVQRSGVTSIAPGPLTSGTTYRLGLIFDGTNATVYLNNSAIANAAASAAFGALSIIAIGARQYPGFDAGTPYQGSIKKMVLTTLALNSTQRSELDTWLSS